MVEQQEPELEKIQMWEDLEEDNRIKLLFIHIVMILMRIILLLINMTLIMLMARIILLKINRITMMRMILLLIYMVMMMRIILLLINKMMTMVDEDNILIIIDDVGVDPEPQEE